MKFDPEPYVYNKTDPEEYAAFEELALLSENQEVMEALEEANAQDESAEKPISLIL